MFAAMVDDDQEIEFLTLEQVRAVHKRVLFENNLSGELKIADLESALGRPKHHWNYGGEQDLLSLAAVLWHGVSVAHGFQDGNKRTGLMCGIIFLGMNGIVVDKDVRSAAPGEFTDAAFEQGRFNVEELTWFLRRHCHWAS